MSTGGRRHKSGAIDVVEAAYDLTAAEDDAWAADVLRAFHPLFNQGLGTGVFMSTPGRPFAAVGAVGVAGGWEAAMHALMTSRDGPSLLRPARPATTVSAVIGREALATNEAMRGPWRAFGVADGAGVTVNDGTGRMLTFFSVSDSIGGLRPSVARRYEQIAAHIGAGWRLRNALRQPTSAVLTPTGKVVHAEGAAQGRSARATLRDAALAMDRARGRLRREGEDEALAIWRVLVDGEWSLVDSFESDGRRYLVARENQPLVPGPRRLTLRERQVLTYLVLGHSMKLIAYELGISPSTVAGVKKKAMRKLGVASVMDVARLFAASATAGDELGPGPDAELAKHPGNLVGDGPR